MDKLGFLNDKLGLVAGIVSVLAIAGSGGWWLMQPSWQPVLNSEDTPQSRVEIRNHLMEWSVPFKEDTANGDLLVKDSDLLAVRTRLSKLGIPEEPGPGLEIFSEAEYGMSEFTQRVNYRRAIEAEVARTIRSFADVTSARVHLTIPKKSIFRDEKVIPKASVTVKPKPGQQLTKSQIKGISELVAAAVEELESENVIVLNDKGEIVSPQSNEGQTDVQQSRFDLEKHYTQKALELVQGVAQTESIKVSVNISYNSDKVKSVREKFLPNIDGEIGHLRRIKRQTTENSGDKGSGSSSNTTLDEEYVFSTERSEIEYASGQIEKIGVGIVVMRDIPPSTIENIIAVVNSGLGIDPARGDDVAVVAIPPLNQATPTEAVAASSQTGPTHLPDNFQLSESLPQQSWTEKSKRRGWLAGSVIGALILFAIAIAAFVSFRKKPQADWVRLSQDEQETLLLELKQWLAQSPTEGSHNA